MTSQLRAAPITCNYTVNALLTAPVISNLKMGNLNSLFKVFPSLIHTILLHGLAIVFSTVSLALFATTLSTYNNKIAPIDGLAPLNDTLLTINAAPVVPLTLSIIWCNALLALCIRSCSRQNVTDSSLEGTAIAEAPLKRPFISPKLEAIIDLVLGVVMVAALGFTSVEVANWRRGDMEGFMGVGNVRLSSCPAVNPATKALEWYCTSAWKRLCDLQIAACCHLGFAR